MSTAFLIKRERPSRFWTLASPLLAIALTVMLAAGLFASAGHPVGIALQLLFIAPVQDLFGLSELALKMTPLLLCALGLWFCFVSGVWNIGAEGQFVMGAIGATWVALNLAPETGGMLMVLLAGILAGAAWAGLAALLKVTVGASEVLTTIMLNYIAINFLMFTLHGPLQDPAGYNFPESALLPEAVLISPISFDYTLNWMFPISLGLALVALGLHRRSLFIYQLRLQGVNQAAASFAGVKNSRVVWFTLLISGGFAGLGGASEMAGPVMQLTPQAAAGYGYSAIIIAFLGRLHPIGIVMASALLSLIYLGGENLQLEYGLPVSVSLLFQATALFLVLACDVLIRYRLVFPMPFQLRVTHD